MKKELTTKPEIKLVGLSVRTNNENEMNAKTSKIGELIQQFYQQKFAEKIKHRKNSGVTYSVYTEYASDEYGDYTYFFGEEVTTLKNIPDDMATLTILAADYQKFTTPQGKMPDIVIQAWQKIWRMAPEELGGQRAYQADFEIYDERASDPLNASVDVYVGVKNT